MSYVIAAYMAVFGTIGLYAGRLFIRARKAAAAVSNISGTDVTATGASDAVPSVIANAAGNAAGPGGRP